MGTLTANLALYKPATTDNVNVATDLNANWDKLDPYFPVAPDNGHAEYSRSTNQTITTGTDTKIAFPDAIVTTPLLTPNGTFDQFTIGRAGVWGLGAGLARWSANPVECFLWIGPSAATTTRYVVDSLDPGVAVARSVYREVQLALNEVISVWCWHNAGANRDITDEWLRSTFFSATWLRPS